MADDLAECFGREIKVLREKAKLSQMQLAAKAGLHLNALGNLERGNRAPSLRTVFLLARALSVSPAKLVERVEKWAPEVS